MASFREMANQKIIKRADAEKIEFCNLHEEEGFNVPGRTDGPEDEDDESLYEHIASGGIYPSLEVRPRDAGGVLVVDGHRRRKFIGRAIDAGRIIPDKDGKFLVPIRQFEGNDVKRLARIATSNEGKKLTPLQRAHIYTGLRGMGLTTSEIAVEVKRTQSHVDQILTLANANHDVQKMVASGEVSATLAIQVQREHGEGAGAVLEAASVKAKASGKERVTAASVKPKKVTQDILDSKRYRWFVGDATKEQISHIFSKEPIEWDYVIDAYMNESGEIYEH